MSRDVGRQREVAITFETDGTFRLTVDGTTKEYGSPSSNSVLAPLIDVTIGILSNEANGPVDMSIDNLVIESPTP